MISLIVTYTIKPGQRDKVIELLQTMGEKVKETEPGCLVYRVHKPVGKENSLMLYEGYANQEAADYHRTTPQFKEIIEGQVIPLLEQRDREQFEVVIDI